MSIIVYGEDCELEVGAHNCNDCGDLENGRVSSVAYISRAYIGTLKADPTNPAVWAAGILSGAIKVIPRTSGSFTPEPVRVTGYGRVSERLVGYNNTLSYRDPDYATNWGFYNGLKDSKIYHVAYATETLLHISDEPVSITPLQPVEDDLNSEVTWNVEVLWQQGPLLQPVAQPEGIFECFTVAPNP